MLTKETFRVNIFRHQQIYPLSVPQVVNEEASLCMSLTNPRKHDFTLYLNGYKYGRSVGGVLKLYRQAPANIDVLNIIRASHSSNNEDIVALEKEGVGIDLHSIDRVELEFDLDLQYEELIEITKMYKSLPV
jgi:hypothetical protein